MIMLEIIWIAILTTCTLCEHVEHKLTHPEGVIETPNYPNNYPPSYSSVWKIIAPRGHYIELTFISFDVEPYDDCSTDVLEVKDGGEVSDPLIGILTNGTGNIRKKGGQYCNQRRPPKVITSTHNQLRLWFSSDSTIQLKGFQLNYKTIPEKGCGGEITAEYGEIVSPRFPFHYPRDCQCEWKIRVPEGKYVALKFVFFEVETRCPSDGPCQCLDSVSLKDGHSKDAKSLGTYCFASPPPIYTSGNELTVNFASDLYGRLQGFKAVFTQSSTERCGGDYSLPNGTIHYPLQGSQTYPPFSGCIWTIRGEKDEYISITFQLMDILTSPRGDCSDDFIEMRDGITSTSPIIGRYCNGYHSKVVMSSSREMFIRFHSNDRDEGKGFKIFYQAHKKTCSSSLGLEDGRISKLSLTVSSTFRIAHKPYELAADYGRLNNQLAWCSQELGTSLVGEYFQISFKGLKKITGIATQGYSMYGNVYYVTKYKIRYTAGNELKHYLNEENASKGLLYTLFNGNSNYNVTKKNFLSPPVVVRRLRLEPLDYNSGKRRHVCLRVEVYGCSLDHGSSGTTVLTNPTGTVQFKSFKKTSSAWVISPDLGATNAVYMVSIKKLESDCLHSRLRISTDGGSSVPSNDTYCNDRPAPYIIVRLASQQLWLNFDIFSTPAGFQGVQFAYEKEDLGFGRFIQSLHGVISGEHHILCTRRNASVWLLKVPKGHRLKLEFQRVQLPGVKIGDRTVGPRLLIKSGLLDSSRVVYELSGYKQPSAFIYSKNELRIEYHTSAIHARKTSEGFTLKYTALGVGISSQDRESIWH